MDMDRIKEKIETQAKEKKIACKQALEIADEESISSRQLGQLLNEMGIKIASCQLGCFP